MIFALTGIVETKGTRAAGLRGAFEQVPLRVVRGQAVTLRLHVVDSAGVNVDLTGTTVTLSIRVNAGDTTVVLSRNGALAALDKAQGWAQIDLSSADTLFVARKYVYDVWITYADGRRENVVLMSVWTHTATPLTSDVAAVGALTAGLYNSASDVGVTNVVYLSASDTVAKARANGMATMPVLGFVSAKPTATTATVVQDGDLGGFSGLVPGAIYFASATTAGGITADANSIPAGGVVQKLGRARNSTTLVLDVDSDFVEL